MVKIKPIKYDFKEYWNLKSTKYDNLFMSNKRGKGLGYYNLGWVSKVVKNGNKVSGVVKGSNCDYSVSIEYLDNDELNTSCECMDFKKGNKYCKHVYALLLADKMDDEKVRLAKVFEENNGKIKELMEEISSLLEENKKRIFDYDYNDGCRCLSFAKEHVDEWEVKGKGSCDALVSLIHDSYYVLNWLIEGYNGLVDAMESGKEELARRKKRDEEEKEFFRKSEGEFQRECALDELRSKKAYEAIDEYLDNVIDSFPMWALKDARKQAIKEGRSTASIDRDIRMKARKDAERREEERRQKKKDRIGLGTIFLGVSAGLMWADHDRKKKAKRDNGE